MSTAAAKAEARRKAILARGNDRLAKLTTSARGEDATFVHDDRPLSGRAANMNAFIGEDSPLPPPKPTSTASATTATPSRPTSSRTASSSASSTVGGSTAGAQDPSVWSQEQQEQFMRALMGAGLTGAAPGAAQDGLPRIGNGTTQPALDAPGPGAEDPMMQLMASLMGGQPGANGQPGASPFGPGAGAPGPFPRMMPPMTAPAPPKPKTIVQKILPLVHLLASFLLLVYFVLWMEPAAYGESGSPWARWNELRKQPGQWGWSLKTVPFFPAFVTLEILLQSIRIMTGLDNVQLPTLLSLALPALPPPIPSLIRNGLQYSQIFTVLLDDIAGAIVALGFIVWASGVISR